MNGRIRPGVGQRVAILGALVAVIIGAAVFERPSTRRSPHPVTPPEDVAQIGAKTFPPPSSAQQERATPVVSEIDTASVTWFCGGAPAGSTTLIFTNRAAATRTVKVTARASRGPGATRTIDVAARSAEKLDASFAGDGSLGAVVESRHGGIFVSQRVVGQDTVTTSQCATSSSDSWHFAGGDTQRGSTERLVLFNPFDDLATADVTFLTPNGFRHPQSTQGLAVPGRSVVVVDVGKVQNRRSDLGTAITTRAGRIVSWRYQAFDGTGPELAGGSPAKGVSVALGLTTPLAEFELPATVTGAGASPRIIVSNPGASASTLRLHFALDDPATNGTPPGVTVDLAAGEVKQLDSEDLRQIPQGVGFTVSGRVVSGGSVVAELWFDGSDPAKGHGSFATPAVPVAATSWVLPVGLASAPLDQLQVDATDRKATVRLWRLGGEQRIPLSGAGLPVEVPSKGLVAIDLAKLLGDHPGATVVVEASAPVVVSRLQAGRDSEGLVTMSGLPVLGGLDPL